MRAGQLILGVIMQGLVASALLSGVARAADEDPPGCWQVSAEDALLVSVVLWDVREDDQKQMCLYTDGSRIGCWVPEGTAALVPQIPAALSVRDPAAPRLISDEDHCTKMRFPASDFGNSESMQRALDGGVIRT